MADAIWNHGSAERAYSCDGKRAIFIEDKEKEDFLVIDFDEIDGLIKQLIDLKIEWKEVYRP